MTAGTLLRRAALDGDLRRVAATLSATSAGVAAGMLVHLHAVKEVPAPPASAWAVLAAGVLVGAPVAGVLLLASELVGLAVDVARLGLARRREWLWAAPAPLSQRVPGPPTATMPAPGPPAQPAPAPSAAPEPAPEPPEQRWAEQWAAMLQEAACRPQDMDPTVARVVAGSVLEVQSSDQLGRFTVRRLVALARPARNPGRVGTWVWACTPRAWELHCATGRAVPMQRVDAQLVVAVEEAETGTRPKGRG